VEGLWGGDDVLFGVEFICHEADFLQLIEAPAFFPAGLDGGQHLHEHG
jgi:hypothetical protein